MDEKDLIIKELLTSMEESKVPFGFESRVMDKIRIEALERESKRETILNIAIAFLVGLFFIVIMLLLNKLFFESSHLSNYMDSMGKMISVFKSGDSLIWVLVGINLSILVICERLLSKKMNLE
jgi:hypothetical protein